MRLALLLLLCSCFHRYPVQPEPGLAVAPGEIAVHRAADVSYRVFAHSFLGSSSIEVQLLNSWVKAVAVEPASAYLVSQKCDARLGEWEYVQGGGFETFGGVDASIAYREDVTFKATQPFWVEAPSPDARFFVGAHGYLLLKYQASRLREECAPYSFWLATDGGPVIAATFIGEAR
jgi:hypothetical protein